MSLHFNWLKECKVKFQISKCYRYYVVKAGLNKNANIYAGPDLSLILLTCLWWPFLCII